MISRFERALNAGERAELTARLRRAQSESATALLKSGAASAAICAVLGILTALASEAPVPVIAAFWCGMALLFTIWVGWPWHRLMRQQIPMLEDALVADRAIETRIQSTRVIEFEEVEDEGACYAFEHEEGLSLFVVGQEFYEDDDFPNTDFSIVDLLGAGAVPVVTLLLKPGSKLRPERVVPATIKNALELPEHLTVLPVPLERVEDTLRGT